MLKKEIIWREILFQAMEKKKIQFTQKEIAQKYNFSLSTVFNALKAPREIGILEVRGRGFKILDLEKFLYFWATLRQFKKDIIYQTQVTKKIRQIEGEMPPEVIFAAYSAFCKKYKEAPADYDKVYVYSPKEALAKIKERFLSQKGYPNLIVLAADPYLVNFGKITPPCQTFVDLWNLEDWYAKDFLNALKEKIFQ